MSARANVVSTVGIETERDLIELRRLAQQIAAGSGLALQTQVQLVIAATEVALHALRRGGGGTVTFRVVGDDDARLEVVADSGSGTGELGALEAASPEAGLACARRNAEQLAIEHPAGGGTTVRLSWTLPPEAQRHPTLGGPPDGGMGALADLLRREDLVLEQVVTLLGSKDSELQRSQSEIAELVEELEETNRGLVALHVELEDAREAEAHLAAIVRSSDDAMWSLTPELTIGTWNAGAEQLLGYRQEEILGRPASILVPEEERSAFTAALEQLSGGEHAVRYDTWRRRKDGSLVEVSVTLSAIRDATDRLVGYSAVVRDLTSRRQAEQALAEAWAAHEVLADRDRIARDLHDLVVQRLFASGMALQGVLSLAEHPQVRSRMENVIDDLDATIAEIRSTIFALGHGPKPAKGGGLRAEMLAVASKAAELLGFQPRLEFSGPVDTAIPDDVADHLLATAREALSNVARHAGASTVEVTVQAGSEIVLEVTDDGRGMGSVTHRSGLANLERRAKMLGGRFEVSANGERGTRVEWRVPLPASSG